MSDEDKPLGFSQHVRSEEQAKLMKPFEEGRCAFDSEHLDRTVNKVFDEGEYWRAWLSPVPYPYHLENIIIAAITHWTRLDEVPPKAWAEAGMMMRSIEQKFKLPGGFFGLRFGSNEYNAGTIAHLHWQVQVPDRTGPGMVVLHKDPYLLTFLEVLAGCKGRPGALEEVAQEFRDLKIRLISGDVIANVDWSKPRK